MLEEFARFVLNDRNLSELAKNIRHDLSQIVATISSEDLLASRDIIEDVGTVISTGSELKRADHTAVVQAAAKRLTEALRALEEYGKVLEPNFGAAMEKLRYRAYDLEKRLSRRANVNSRFERVKLYVLLTSHYCRGSLLDTARQILAAGADCLQLREKGLEDAELLDLAATISQLCHEHDALFIMNDRADIAYLADADGVHLGQADLPVRKARKILKTRQIIGKSSHSMEEAQNVLDEGVDYLAVGSIFASATKPEVAQSGLELIRSVRAITQCPIIAIGGIDPSNVAQVIEAGASGIALCQAILAQNDPATVTGKILQAISKSC